MWVEFVDASLLASRGFSPGTLVFPYPEKPTLPNSNSIQKRKGKEKKGTLFKCLVILAVKHQLGTLSTEINNYHKSSQMLVFEERVKLEYPEKNLSVQTR